MKKELIINDEMNLDKIEKEVAKTLIKLCIPVNLKGYGLLKDSIILCIQDSEYCCGVTKKLYPTLRKIYNTGDVDRNIRTAINHSYTKGGLDYMYELFNYRSDILTSKPTVTDFISTISECIKLDIVYKDY